MHSTGIIFKRTLYDNRRSILWWSLGMVLMGLYIVIAYPTIGGLEEFSKIMKSPLFQVLLGDIGDMDWTTPQGFLGIELFSWIPMILAVYAVMFGINITGGEEIHGTIDILLSTPTPRWQVIAEKFLAYIVGVLFILGTTVIGMFIGIVFTPQMQPAASVIAWGMLNLMPTMLFIGALALLLSTLLRSPGQAGGIVAGIIIASYFLNSIADMTNNAVMKGLQLVSFYKYYAPLAVASGGINWAYFSFLVLVSAVLFGLSIYFFERRDIYV